MRAMPHLAFAALAVALTVPTVASGAAFEASGWVPYWAQDEASRTIKENHDLFAGASPFWFSTDENGRIKSAPGAEATDVTDRLRAAGADVIPTVTAPITPRQAIDLFTQRSSRRKHVRRLVNLAEPYDGIDLNYEHPALTTRRRTAKRVRSALSSIFDHACAALQRNDRTCVVTVMPRTESKRTTWRGVLTPWVYDYRAIGDVADRVRVMAYDQHAGSYGPGPVGGAKWTRNVARYSEQTMPARKIELGLPLYGRQWENGRERTASGDPHAVWRDFSRVTGGTEISSVTWSQAVQLRRQCGAKARWSKRFEAPWFRCDSRIVWFSNARSTRVRARIAKGFGLRGVAFWAPYGEDPATWKMLRRSSLFG